jgi:hypothetical protein
MRRRVEVEPDDIAELGDERRVAGELEGLPAVRLQPVRLPDAPHSAGADPGQLRHHVLAS